MHQNYENQQAVTQMSSEVGHDTSAYQISRHPFLAFSLKCLETFPGGRKGQQTQLVGHLGNDWSDGRTTWKHASGAWRRRHEKGLCSMSISQIEPSPIPISGEYIFGVRTQHKYQHNQNPSPNCGEWSVTANPGSPSKTYQSLTTKFEEIKRIISKIKNFHSSWPFQ